MSSYAEVILDLVSHAVDRPFHYRIPHSLQGKLRPGMLVRVPLGPRRCRAYVFRLLDRSEVPGLRDILALESEEPLLTPEQLALVPWLALRSFCRRIDAINAILPASFRQGRRSGRVSRFHLAPGAAEADLGRAPAQGQALRLLQERGPLDRRELALQGVRSATLRALQKKGLIRDEDSYPSLEGEDTAPPTSPHCLQPEQAACYNHLQAALQKDRPARILLHGVTASGKTELYMQSLAFCLARGRSALVLVPEIALTPQMIEQFSGRFPGQVAVLHSRLTAAEKNRQWRSILQGEARVVLGPRSAVFAPLERLGLVIIDEEHETTYKQEETPRYHARDVAAWRARYNRAVLLLGSATPSLESYYATTQGRSLLLEMKERVTPSSLPPVEVVDMRLELREGHRQIFSRSLLKALQNVIARDEQALLFINRRGFAGFVLCRECGYVVRCPSCDVSLTLHLDSGLMRCHYCAREEHPPESCPSCRGIKIRYFSAGTQRVEEEVRRLFPAAPFIRMDSDTTTSRQAHQLYYRRFRERRASILIGTQMIAKGFDFPGVTLVGVVAADTTLHLPDFRAPERTFQLLTQVAGRAARGEAGGRVIVQTYHPGHYSIKAAAAHDYAAFYKAEIASRRSLAYPPFNDLVRFLLSGPEEDSVFRAAAAVADLIATGAAGAAGLEVLGPAPASLFRIREQYRVQIIVKGPDLARFSPAFKKLVQAYHQKDKFQPVRLAVDYNPLVVL